MSSEVAVTPAKRARTEEPDEKEADAVKRARKAAKEKASFEFALKAAAVFPVLFDVTGNAFHCSAHLRADVMAMMNGERPVAPIKRGLSNRKCACSGAYDGLYDAMEQIERLRTLAFLTLPRGARRSRHT